MNSKKLIIIQIKDVNRHTENNKTSVKDVRCFTKIKTLIDRIKLKNPNTEFLNSRYSLYKTYITTQAQKALLFNL